MSDTGVMRADYKNPVHANEIVTLLNAYACDVMGGGSALEEEVKKTLVAKLASRQDAITLLYLHKGKAVALLNAFEGFSTFAAAPLINVHDVFVTRERRGQGIADQLFKELESIALKRGCCKITLEVLSNNHTAKAVYARLGFKSYELKPDAGQAVFWQKKL